MTTHTDIKSGDWIDHFLPVCIVPFARLMRLDRPIGVWLLLWPCLFSLTLASTGIPSLRLCLLFSLGALVMRGAGCVVNDLYDRNLDKQVERTANRPLASGVISVKAAIVFLLCLLALGAAVLSQLNVPTIVLGLCSIPLIFLYPLAKRVTWWPQLILGLTFNWGALMGWSAVHGEIGTPAVLLYIGCVFWTLGYDTIYAHQDKKDDALVGIKSLALHLGDHSRPWLSSFYVLFFFFVIAAAIMAEMGSAFYYALFAAQLYALWLLVTWKMDDAPNCLKRFKSNNALGALVFHAMLIGQVAS